MVSGVGGLWDVQGVRSLKASRWGGRVCTVKCPALTHAASLIHSAAPHDHPWGLLSTLPRL
jgi:hypothetical protein